MPGRDTAPGFLLAGSFVGRRRPGILAKRTHVAKTQQWAERHAIQVTARHRRRTMSCIFLYLTAADRSRGRGPQTYSYTVRPATMVRTTRPCSLRLVERRVLAFRLELGGVEHPGRVEVDHDHVGRAALPQRCRPARPRISAGRLDIALIRVMSGSSPLWTRRRPAREHGLEPDRAGARFGERQALALHVLRIVVGHHHVDEAGRRAPRPAPCGRLPPAAAG